MAGITLAQAEAKLAEWLEADSKVAAGQEATIAGQRLTRADAATIRANIEFWDLKVRTLSGSGGSSGIRVRGVTPV